MDDTDRKILTLLSKEGYVQPCVNAIAQEVGKAAATVHERISKMKKDGILLGFSPEFSLQKIGVNIVILSLYRLDLSRKKDFEEVTKASSKNPCFLAHGPIIPTADRFNWYTIQAYESIEQYDRRVKDYYESKFPQLNSIILEKKVFLLPMGSDTPWIELKKALAIRQYGNRP